MNSQIELTLFDVGVASSAMVQLPLSQTYALAFACQHMRVVFFVFEQQGLCAW